MAQHFGASDDRSAEQSVNLLQVRQRPLADVTPPICLPHNRLRNELTQISETLGFTLGPPLFGTDSRPLQ